MIIPITIENQSYDIVLEKGALQSVGRLLDLERKVLIITDDDVPFQYAETVANQAKQPVIATIPAGEASKSFQEFERLLALMVENGFTRKDCVVAVGGGVVGDLSGFVASTYMRGVDFYNIPTTLLSQVDSSIGGKTAIDFKGIKNIVGTFYQPKKVVIDPDTLATLCERETFAGLVEAIKMALSYNQELFEKIEQTDNLEEDLEDIIAGALQIKKEVVEQDPKETGLRRVLNFGHTIGHALESFYAGKLLHGEAIALGMLPMTAPAIRSRLKAVLEKYHQATEIEPRTEELMPYIKHDKKMLSDTIVIVYVSQVGQFELREVGLDELTDFIDSLA